MTQTLHFYWATWQKRRRAKSPDRFGSCIFPVSLKTKFIGEFNLRPAGDSFTTAPMRSSTAHNGMRDHNNVPESTKTRTVLAVAPLNSVPYIGPSTGYSPVSANRANDNAEKGGPAMIFLPSESAQEWDNLVAQTKTGVALTGSAAMGNIGPAIGLVDIAESDDSYYFRVSLPGVSRDEKDFSCDIEPDGKILIKGATTTGEKTVCKHSQVFKMQTQNLCPPGHFTMSFQLPGPVNNEEFNGHFGSDGVLEGHVKKPSTELSSKADREQD